MESESSFKHTLGLDAILKDVSIIGENSSDIVSIIREPIWTPFELYGGKHCLCDLIILYHDRTASACELKGTVHQHGKAMKQIKAGKEYIHEVLRYNYRYGLYVVHIEDRYKIEKIK